MRRPTAIDEASDEEIIKLIEAGNTRKDIAVYYNVTYPIAARRINKIDETKLQEAKGKTKLQEAKEKAKPQEGRSTLPKKKRKKRKTTNIINVDEISDEELLKQIEDIGNITNIAEYYGVTRKKMNRRINEIDEVKREEAKKRRRQKLKEERAKQKEKQNDEEKNEEQTQENMQLEEKSKFYEVKEKLSKSTITADDIRNYRSLITEDLSNITIKEIRLMIDIYLKTLQTTEAGNFLDSIINSNQIKVPIEVLRKYKEQILEKQKIQIERNLQKGNRSSKESINPSEEEPYL